MAKKRAASVKRPRHGHLPGHIRDEFGDAIDEYLEGKVKADRLLKACGQVWNCTDITPRTMHEAGAHIVEDQLPARRTYAALARSIRRALSEQ